MQFYEIQHDQLSINTVADILHSNAKLRLSDNAVKSIMECRAYLDKKVANSDRNYYGINTGFGSLCNVSIPPADISSLQHNLVMSHACGTGNLVPIPIVRIMLLLKIQSLSYGHSGAALETVNRLVDMYNEEVYPVIYDTGSLGASGDLAPLAHLSLPLIGLGEVYVKGERKSSASILQQFGWGALKLQSKEGLALLNGTQFMSSYGVYLLLEARKLCRNMDVIASMSLDGFDCRMEPFSHLVHQIRPHKGQIATAKAIRDNLNGSSIASQEKTQVQDPYSFRCIPQVHGATMDVIDHVESVFTTEINAVTDNPNVFPVEDEIISAGNFHGQVLALALDYLKLALSELGNISERRVYLMLSGQRDLPTYLTRHSGLHSGLMIPQYTAASIVSKNKQLCTPASADSVPSSNGQEDHVSMGANAATQCLQILENVQQIAGIELLNAAQALDFRKPARSSNTIMSLHAAYRKVVPFIDEDRVMTDDMLASKVFVQEMK